MSTHHGPWLIEKEHEPEGVDEPVARREGGTTVLRRRARTALALAAAVALVATGCSDEEKKTSVDLERTPASASATPTDEAPGAIPEEPVDGELTRGLNPAESPAERQVADVWFSFWTELQRMYTEVELDRSRLGELARGEAFDGPASYVESMQKNKTRNEGGTIASIQKIKVDGTTAVVKSCIRTSLLEVTDKGAPVELPEPYLVTRETLEQEGPDWRVVKHESGEQVATCEYR